jgi:hypothetical protein
MYIYYPRKILAQETLTLDKLNSKKRRNLNFSTFYKFLTFVLGLGAQIWTKGDLLTHHQLALRIGGQ